VNRWSHKLHLALKECLAITEVLNLPNSLLSQDDVKIHWRYLPAEKIAKIILLKTMPLQTIIYSITT